MTHIIYSHQQLQLKSIARLKQIYSEIACTAEVSDKSCKDSWITAIASRAPEAIAEYQASKIQKLAPAAPDEQALAQAELDGFIATQAQAIAPELLTTVEINSNHYEIYAGKQLIAYIAYDHGEFVTQPWVVMVNGEEKFRDTTVSRCQRFISWHHKDGTLNPFVSVEVPEVPTISELSFYDQEAFVNRELIAGIFYDHENYENLYWRVIINDKEIFRDTTSARCHSYVKQQYQQGTLPVQEPFEEAEVLSVGSKGEEIFSLHLAPCSLSSSTTGNEIMAQIFNQCEKYGFEILDDGIYHNDVKLGEVGCTDGGWWVKRASSGHQQKVACNSAMSAVQSLSMVDVSTDGKSVFDEYFLEQPLEQLTGDQLQQLLERAELVTA
jgi:hypothetical protein